MTTVVITGASGQVGTTVLAAVRRLASVDTVVAVDRLDRDPDLPDEVEYRRADVADRAGIRGALEGADVVVHLASLLGAVEDPARMRSVHVDGTQHVAEAALATGAARLVVASSTVVYGAHPDNPVPLTEESPLRARPDVPHAEHRRDADRWLGQWADRHPDVAVCRLRLATVVGDGATNVVTRSLLAPRLPSIRGHRPPYQFLHVEDAAAAVAHAVEHGLQGPYNVAAEGWLSFDEVSAILGRRPLDVPEELAFSALGRLEALGLSELPVGAVHYVMHPWVASVDRLVATGWQPRYSNRDAAVVLARDLGDQLVLGPVETSRRTLRRAALAGAAVAGGVLALGVLAWRRRGTRS